MTFIPKLGRTSGYLVLKEGAARSLRNTQRFTEMAHHTGPWGFCLQMAAGTTQAVGEGFAAILTRPQVAPPFPIQGSHNLYAGLGCDLTEHLLQGCCIFSWKCLEPVS